MTITKINGNLFKVMMQYALNNLICHEEEINRINVFPISDGDTGTNMRITLENAFCSSSDSENLGEYLRKFSRGMLFGARGNSGVILSQFFKGVYIYLENKSEADISEFANALFNGSKCAYKAVVNPVEGTILTVTREGIISAIQKLSPSTDLISFLELYISCLNSILVKTPEYLPLLKENNVVDSGSVGFIKIIEGMKNCVSEKTKEFSEEKSNYCQQICNSPKTNSSFTKDSCFTLGYCMEFILQFLESKCSVSQVNYSRIMEDLDQMGESLVAVQEDSLIKIHIHVKNPVPVISYILQFGEFISFKLENMQLQHNQTLLQE